MEKRTGGALKMDIHWGGALLKGPAAIKGVGDGVADMGLIVAVYNPASNPATLLADLPSEYNDPWAASRAFYQLSTTDPVLQKEWDDLNVRFVSNMSTGPLQLVCNNKVVNSVADFAGLKIKGISNYSKVAQDLGANMVSMTAYDTYAGLDTGLVDCAIFYTYAIPAFKIPEVSTDLTLLDWGALMGLAIVINKDVWAGLTPEQQAIIDQLGAEYVDVISEKIVVEKKATLDALRAEGKLTLHDFAPEERRKLLDAGQKYVEEWKATVAKRGIDGEGLANRYDALLKKWHAKLSADGYPWEG
ncbi:MAG: C4-dicarboxylate TRAP transporter substrate-binding protein [Pseudodonghicola sp.]